MPSDTTPGLLDIHFEIGADVDTPEPLYISEDSRFSLLCTNLRVIETLFRDIAAKSFGSSASLPQEVLRLLPSILQTLIRESGKRPGQRVANGRQDDYLSPFN
ncbi:hypothetical protein BKA61DRAFT_582422 [Leptodontidium sp. MPI-SDFR-AT-0119]|nr:hypothetical protein BKA61DRAFT_582422 [Leptodontidium sp. MPI-SDFR-AT-0119]